MLGACADGDSLNAFGLDVQCDGVCLVVLSYFITGHFHLAINGYFARSRRRPGQLHIGRETAVDGRAVYHCKLGIVGPHQLHGVGALVVAAVVADTHGVG